MMKTILRKLAALYNVPITEIEAAFREYRLQCKTNREALQILEIEADVCFGFMS